MVVVYEVYIALQISCIRKIEKTQLWHSVVLYGIQRLMSDQLDFHHVLVEIHPSAGDFSSYDAAEQAEPQYFSDGGEVCSLMGVSLRQGNNMMASLHKYLLQC